MFPRFVEGTFEGEKGLQVFPRCFPVFQLRWKAAKVSTFRLWRCVLLGMMLFVGHRVDAFVGDVVVHATPPKKIYGCEFGV